MPTPHGFALRTALAVSVLYRSPSSTRSSSRYLTGPNFRLIPTCAPIGIPRSRTDRSLVISPPATASFRREKENNPPPYSNSLGRRPAVVKPPGSLRVGRRPADASGGRHRGNTGYEMCSRGPIHGEAGRRGGFCSACFTYLPSQACGRSSGRRASPMWPVQSSIR